ncbi:MAG: hypothetical protein HOP28_03235 [Gemmatimonadales bacterium]|nr:hypothetical protein [Gemmatimonadales bacterium]
MVRTTSAVLLALALPTVALAQGRPVVEIGTSLGVSIVNSDGNSVAHFGIPGQGILGQPTIYASFFAGSSVLLEPQVALNVLSGGGVTATTVGLGGQIGYLTKGSAVNSPFFAGTVAFQSVSGGGESESDFGLGGKVGYRLIVGSSVGLRFEAGYRRWVDSHLNEITFGIGLGGIIR